MFECVCVCVCSYMCGCENENGGKLWKEIRKWSEKKIQNKIIIFHQVVRVSIYRNLQINLQVLLKMDWIVLHTNESCPNQKKNGTHYIYDTCNVQYSLSEWMGTRWLARLLPCTHKVWWRAHNAVYLFDRQNGNENASCTMYTDKFCGVFQKVTAQERGRQRKKKRKRLEEKRWHRRWMQRKERGREGGCVWERVKPVT